MSRTERRNAAFREIHARRGQSVASPPPRSARLPEFIGPSRDPGEALGGLRVLVVGTGSVGERIASHLARHQIGSLALCDNGSYKPESLLTHGIPPVAVGRRKALYAARQCKVLSPATRVFVFDGPVQSLPMQSFATFDAAVMATDNLAAEIAVGNMCLHHRLPLLQASVHGPTLVAQARFWSNRDGRGACPCCAYSAAEWAHVSRETVFRCAGPSTQPHQGEHVMPTMSVSSLCSMAADIATMLLLRHALGLGRPLEDSLIEWCGYTCQSSVSPLPFNPNCRSDHDVAWGTLALAGPLAARSAGQLARAALGTQELPPGVAFAPGDDLVFVEKVLCCGWPQEVRRFSAPGVAVANCCRCGKPLKPQTFYSHRPVPADVLGPLADRPLRRLGAGSARAAVVHVSGRAVLCQEEDLSP